MSDTINPDENAIVPHAKQDLIVRSSGLAKRGLESLLAKEKRIIHFPIDRSIGRLWIGDTGAHFMSPFWGYSVKLLGDAKGTVEVPRGKFLALFPTSSDLSALSMLESTDLDGLDFTSKRLYGNDKYKFDNDHLVDLKRLTSLQLLNFSYTEISDAELAYLKGLTSLEWLDLHHTKISDAGLVNLEGLTSVQVLVLYDNPNISDAGLVHLKELTSLRALQLSCTEVSNNGLTYLRDILKNSTIAGGDTLTSTNDTKWDFEDYLYIWRALYQKPLKSQIPHRLFSMVEGWFSLP